MPYPVVISRSLASGLSHKKGKDKRSKKKHHQWHSKIG